MNQVVVGMAGHIDHGKTSIIKSLTGTQTERYAEEVERGLTIDIGFAFLSENITLIDVPGHERFIKNMLTGSYGIDFAILVIAADDGIMPQTKEHFEILKILGVQQGLIVLNKIDLADEDWIELLIEDIAKMTKESFLENSKIIKTSTIKNIGIQKLKDEIFVCSENIPSKHDRGFFRMAVDRAFTIKGYGTVTTGTVTSGKISVGDTINVMPNDEQYKIRGIHSHEQSVTTVEIGSRAAINISNLNIENIYRGHQISSPGYLTSAKNLLVSCTLLETAKKSLKQNQRIRVHIGTSESIGRVSLVDMDSLKPGKTSILLIKLESDIITIMDDKFILRTFSPLVTIGGGIVIDKIVNKKWKEIKKYIKDIEKLNKNQIKHYMIESQEFKPLTYHQTQVKFGLGDKQIDKFINYDNQIDFIKYKSQKWLATKKQIAICRNYLLVFLKSNNDEYDIGFSKSLIVQNTNGNEKFLDYLLERLQESNEIYKKNEKWIVKGEMIVLDDFDKSLKDNLLNILNKEGLITSDLEELSLASESKKEKVKKILNILEKDNQIVRLNENLIFSTKNLNNLKNDLNDFFLSNKILSMQKFKEMTGTTRKYAVPLLEYFDKIKLTFRVDEGRKLIQ